MTTEVETKAPDPPDPPKKKSIDPPHRISLVLSIVAIVTSVISWREARLSRLVSQGANRPILSLKWNEVGSITKSLVPADSLAVPVSISLENTGKLEAERLRAEASIQYQPSLMEQPRKCENDAMRGVNPEQSFNLLPGETRRVFFVVSFRTSCFPAYASVFIDVEYHSPSGPIYRQEFSESLGVINDTDKFPLHDSAPK